MTETAKNIASLRRQLAEARENLLLIQERKAEFVMGTSVPLDLIKEERRTERQIEELEQRLRELEQLTPTPSSTHTTSIGSVTGPVHTDSGLQLNIIPVPFFKASALLSQCKLTEKQNYAVYGTTTPSGSSTGKSSGKIFSYSFTSQLAVSPCSRSQNAERIPLCPNSSTFAHFENEKTD
jgi:hypothetical protein